MSVSAVRAFYVHCTDCHYETFDFSKKDATRHVTNHDCKKYLERRWSLNDAHLLERFEITVGRRRS